MTKPRMTRPLARVVSPRTNAPALRRRAEAYRDKADALEAMLKATQDHFAESFAAADSQMSTRDRINNAARKPAHGGRWHASTVARIAKRSPKPATRTRAA